MSFFALRCSLLDVEQNFQLVERDAHSGTREERVFFHFENLPYTKNAHPRMIVIHHPKSKTVYTFWLMEVLNKSVPLAAMNESAKQNMEML